MLSKVLTSALCGACLEECPQPHSRLLLCKYIVNLLWLLQMHDKAWRSTRRVLCNMCSMVQVGARAATATASNVHRSFGESNLIAQTAAARPQALLGLDLCSPFESFSSPSTQCQAQARTCQDLPSLQLKECFDCVSPWVLLYLHPDLLIF